MNCAHCGAPVTLEDKYCPHCGQPNIQAAQHSEDMARYRNEFENTRRGVHGTLRAYKGITARLILFIIALISTIVTFGMWNSAYSIHRDKMYKYAKAHSAEVIVRNSDASVSENLKYLIMSASISLFTSSIALSTISGSP